MGHSSLTVSLHTSHTQRDTHTQNAEPFVDVLYNKAASVWLKKRKTNTQKS